MPNTTISFQFPEYKLKAIQQALAEKQEQTTIPELLLEHVDGLYQKNVPAPARKYLDAMLGEQSPAMPEQQAQQPVNLEQRPESPARRPYTRRNQPAQQQEPSLTVVEGQTGQEPEPQEQERGPEISLSM